MQRGRHETVAEVAADEREMDKSIAELVVCAGGGARRKPEKLSRSRCCTVDLACKFSPRHQKVL